MRLLVGVIIGEVKRVRRLFQVILSLRTIIKLQGFIL
jgi:hypothetical protein